MNALQSPPTEPAVSIPENAPHAVSVSLPLWAYNVAYEEGDPELSAKMRSGYPRFKIHFKVEELVKKVEEDYGRNEERAMLFPNSACAKRCRDFILARHPEASVRVLQLSCPKQSGDQLDAKITAVFFKSDLFPVAKQYWQHTGEGISSRNAEYFLDHLIGAEPEEQKTQPEDIYVEERFGRYLSEELASEAKHAVRKRIQEEFAERTKLPIKLEDVFLYPTGMTSIYSAYRLVLGIEELQPRKAVCFGFPYTDTLKVLQKWGPGCEFFPFGDDAGDLKQLESKLESGELKISSLFCEVPTNPLLKTPNLKRLRELADKHQFAIVVDDTVGNVLNINTLQYADVCVSSLTKLFSGDCNVMGGDLVLNPLKPFYQQFKRALADQYIDSFWGMDAIYLERNSRDFYARNKTINRNAEAVVELLLSTKDKFNNKLIRDVYYPSCSPTKANYDALRYPDGGYGGLLSVVFQDKNAAIAFFDALFIAKGPSLGTNFTLSCPYTVIAHYNELPFVNSCGVDTHLVRVSVGLEEPADLRQRFQKAVDVAAKACNL